MKKKKLATTLLAGVMALSAIGVSPAFAATGTKTATLNNAKVRFNNGAVQTIQCYNIDGFNFVRARDVTNNLDMAVYAILNGNKGVMVDPLNKPTSKSVAEKLTQQTAKVKVETGQLIYDGMMSEAECFLLNGRYYFKLADFAKASDRTFDVTMENVEIDAKGNFVDEPFFKNFSGISVEWNNDTKVIDVNRVETDLVEIFNDIRGGKAPAAKPDKEEVADKDEEKEPEADKEETFEGVGVLTSAPKEGEILANILKDKDEGAYLADGSVNWDNLNKPYTRYTEKNVGQCTWYAEGRFVEVYGEQFIADNSFEYGSSVEEWIKNAKSSKCPDLDGVENPKSIEAGCIAVFEGHALFVEWVDFDDEGNPETVYFTEGNTQHNGKYYPDKDARVQVMDFDDFIERQEFIGYVIVK